MTEKTFKDKGFDKKLYSQLIMKQEKAAEMVQGAIKAIQDVGLHTDRKTIEKVTATKTSFKEHIEQLADARIGTGFIPTDEKMRLSNVFFDVYRRLNDNVQALRENLPNVVLVDDGDTLKVDARAMEKRVKDAASYSIDAEKMDIYYDLVMNVKTALDAVKTFEEANGLQNFAKGVWYGELTRLTMSRFFEIGATPELFEEVMRSGFIRK